MIIVIAVKGTITIPNTGTAADSNNANNEILSKTCAPLADYINEINSMQIDIAKDIDVLMNMYNSIEYSENYSQTYGSSWQNYRDQPSLNNGDIINFPVNYDTSLSFKYKKI